MPSGPARSKKSVDRFLHSLFFWSCLPKKVKTRSSSSSSSSSLWWMSSRRKTSTRWQRTGAASSSSSQASSPSLPSSASSSPSRDQYYNKNIFCLNWQLWIFCHNLVLDWGSCLYHGSTYLLLICFKWWKIIRCIKSDAKIQFKFLELSFKAKKVFCIAPNKYAGQQSLKEEVRTFFGKTYFENFKRFLPC